MKEVVVRLQFTTPCLGGDRSKLPHAMPRNQTGQVVFLQTWWRSILRDAAKARSWFHRIVDKIQVDPEIDGITHVYQRFYNTQDSTPHEAFLEGDIVGVSFILPKELKVSRFEEMLSMAGSYWGISPYKPRENWGRFIVLEVVTQGAKRDRNPKKRQSNRDKPTSFGATPAQTTTDVQKSISRSKE